MTEQELNKACEWLKEHAHKYIYDSEVSRYKPPRLVISGKCWEDFRKAMRISGNNEEIPSNSCNSDKNLQGLTWHKASEELPKKDDVYYVAGMGFYDKANWCKGQWRNFSAPITHWMPIPELPKED